MRPPYGLCKKKAGEGMVKWTQVCGHYAQSQSLILVGMRDRTTIGIARAPGPGPLRTEEWFDVGRPLLEDKRIILHTDSAKIYRYPP
eukprot:5609941-Amphidinium_carterae.1